MRRADAWLAAAAGALLALPLLPAGLARWSLPGGFGDLVAYHYPLRHLVATALICGRLPFWNPYLFAGLPLAANPQSVLYYPPSSLDWLFPLTRALSWDFWLHLCWAVAGAALLARRAGLSAAAAWALGLCYALCPFVAYRVVEGIPTLLASLSWAPWCWLFWVYGARGLLAGALALQLFSGHPQFCAVNALGLAVWTACVKPGRLRALALEGLAAAAMTCVLWVPLFEFLGQSVRKSWPASFSLGYSVGLRELSTWVWPGALGDPLRGTWAGVPSVFLETTGVFLGPALLLSFFGLSASRAALLAAGAFLAAGANNPAYRALLSTPVGFLRTPSRALFLDLWGLWLSACAGWLALRRRGQGRLGTGLAAAAVACLLAWDAPFLKPADAFPYLAVNPKLAQQMGDAPFRVLGDPGLANQDKAMLYRTMNVNGYDAFYLAGYPEFAARSEGKPAADASRTYLSRGDTAEMRLLGVGYKLSAEGALVKAAPGASLPLAYFVDGAGKPIAQWLKLSRERAERWTVGARTWPQGAAALVLSQSAYPGWRAWDAGEEIALVRFAGLLQAYRRPAGADGPVDLVALFRPSRYGLLVAAALAGWAAWSLWLWRRA